MEKVAGCNPILTLGGRVKQGVTLAILAVAAVAAGLYFGWDSLAALGLTGIIISLLPCLLMCAAGVCMSRMGGKKEERPKVFKLARENAEAAPENTAKRATRAIK